MPDGHLLKLNSYENRVFQIGIDEAAPMVGKFYRPSRWSDAQIQEEHDFAQALADADIPVVAPWRSAARDSLFAHQGYRYALFPRRGGRAPEPTGTTSRGMASAIPDRYRAVSCDRAGGRVSYGAPPPRGYADGIGAA